MHINEVIADGKAKAAYSKRRAQAVKEHGKTVVVTAVGAAKDVAKVAVQNLITAAETQKDTILDRELPIRAKARRVRSNAIEAATTARSELTAAVKDAYLRVKDRAEHVTAVTHKEQAIENKIERRAKKLRKAAADA